MTIKTDTGPFSIVPEWVLDLELPPGAVVLYAILGRYADAQGDSFPSRATLAKRCRCSVDTLDRWKTALVEAGALTVEHRTAANGDHDSNLYHLFRTPPGSRTDAATGDRTTAATGSRTDAAQNENQLEREPMERDMAPTARKTDVLWEAVMTECGIDSTAIPDSARGAYNKALKGLRQAGAQPNQVHDRANTFRQRWPEASVTPTSLARRWAEIDPGRQEPARRLPKSASAIQAVRERHR